jgi:hypothetical protein
MYGLVQASRKWWKQFKGDFAGYNNIRRKVDPSLFIKKPNGAEPM